MQPRSCRIALFTLSIFAALGLAARARAETISTFLNPTPIAIPGMGDVGVGNPYPSFITVSGLEGAITEVTVTLFGLSHTSILDVGALLVGPGGQSVVLMDFVGSGEVLNATYTFDDAAADHLSFVGVPPSGTYKPTAYDEDGNIVSQFHAFDPPAPSSGYSGAGLSIFTGLDPNGVWALFVQDFFEADTGVLAGGWSLTITTQAVPEPCSLLLLGAGALPLAVRAWRRRAAANFRTMPALPTPAVAPPANGA